MSSFSQTIICGNVGKAPEIRRTTAGDPVASFSVATSESWTDKATNEKKERTEWHRVTCFSEGICKVVEQYVKKGSKVLIVGEMRTRDWEDKDGIKRYSTELVIPRFGGALKLMGSPTGSTRSEDDHGTTRTKEPRETSAEDYREKREGGGRASGYGDTTDDDVPFEMSWR